MCSTSCHYSHWCSGYDFNVIETLACAFPKLLHPFDCRTAKLKRRNPFKLKLYTYASIIFLIINPPARNPDYRRYLSIQNIVAKNDFQFLHTSLELSRAIITRVKMRKWGARISNVANTIGGYRVPSVVIGLVEDPNDATVSSTFSPAPSLLTCIRTNSWYWF